MATFLTNRSVMKILNRTLDITTGCKVMLCTASLTADQDTDFIGSAGGSAGATEITATGYTRGFGGAGRKSTTTSFAEQDASNRAVVITTDVTWNPLGGATNDTVGFACLVKEVTTDADSELIAVWDLADTTTNGSSFSLTMDASSGNLRFTT
jgi:hypothetical protein